MITPLILGSESPRRQEILNYFTLPFQQVSSAFDESIIPFNGDPKEYVTELSIGKARSLETNFPNDTILTADTVVYREGKIYGKPASEKEATSVLSELIGHWHSVYTGVAVLQNGKLFHGTEETKVLFNALTDEEVNHYHKQIDWKDKAGGYTIQMAGGLLVKRIDGCYYNVMGLPINTVRKLLLEVGIELWYHLD